jgi:D-glycero-alpha-D-manno-heptose-7-phosphate kinase
MVIAAAINKYIYIAINSTFTNDYFIKYSEHERVAEVGDIRHPIVRRALQRHPVGPVEIVSVADVPAGTGLGSSGSFTVGLLRALYAFRHEHVTAGELAEEACDIEITELNRPVGKQDQYIGAYGGLTCFEFDSDDRVRVAPLQMPRFALRDLEERLLLFFTGYSRSADDLLADQLKRSEQGDPVMLSNLDAVVQIGHQVKEALERGDCRAFADLMHEHWLVKQARVGGFGRGEDAPIARWYEIGRAHGARGGKLVGAGGGGFLLFYADEPGSLRKAMAAEGLREVPFHFDYDGTALTARDA